MHFVAKQIVAMYLRGDQRLKQLVQRLDALETLRDSAALVLGDLAHDHTKVLRTARLCSADIQELQHLEQVQHLSSQ